MPSTTIKKKFIFSLFVVAMYWLISTTVIAIESTSAQSSPEADIFYKQFRAPISSKAKPISFEKIDNRTGQIGLMLSARYPLRHGDADILSAGEKKDNPSISSSHIVSRKGKSLVIQREDGKPPFQFLDWTKTVGAGQEGDSESFVYAGSLGNSGYLKVDVFYGHDSPGSFLINPKNGDALLIHTGGDLASLSKDEKTLMIMNHGLNPSFSILVATLNQSGHNITLRCREDVGDRGFRIRPKIIPFFTGWHIKPYVGFDLFLIVQESDNNSVPRYEAIPVQFSEINSKWHVFVPDPQRFVQSTALKCWE
jgi:hypothetical protein